MLLNLCELLINQTFFAGTRCMGPVFWHNEGYYHLKHRPVCCLGVDLSAVSCCFSFFKVSSCVWNFTSYNSPTCALPMLIQTLIISSVLNVLKLSTSISVRFYTWTNRFKVFWVYLVTLLLLLSIFVKWHGLQRRLGLQMYSPTSTNQTVQDTRTRHKYKSNTNKRNNNKWIYEYTKQHWV